MLDFFQQAYADQFIGPKYQDRTWARLTWEWINYGNPQRLDDGQLPAWICSTKGRIVGHFGVIPGLARFQDHIQPVCWGRDLIVAPDFRNRGVGPLLIMSVVDAVQVPFLVAGLNDQVYPIYQGLGFYDLGRMPLFIKILSTENLLEHLGLPPPIARSLAWGTTQLARAMHGTMAWRRMRGLTGLEVIPFNEFDERFDEWWLGVEGSFTSVSRRTSSTMNWRYFQHPDRRCHAVAAKCGRDLRGFMILRCGQSGGFRAGFISELLTDPRDTAAMSCLVRYAELYFRSEGPVDFIRCAVMHPTFEYLFRCEGFLPIRSSVRCMVSLSRSTRKMNGAFPLSEWFLNSGDSDIDFF